MAGLVGVFARGAPLGPAAAADIAAAYEHVRGPADGGETLTAADWGAVFVSGAGAPATLERTDGGWTAVVGRRHETTLPDGFHEGHFAAVSFDGLAVCVRNDPFGMQALYLAETADRWWVSTSAAVLARLVRAPVDPVGVSVFLRVGLQCGPATHWAGVERLGPATELWLTRDTARRRTYWRPAVDAGIRTGSFERAVDACVEGLEVAVSRQDGDAIADLTGGFDSRMVVAAMVRGGHPPAAVTTAGPPGAVDVRLAQEMAGAGDLQWLGLDLGDDWPEQAPDAFDQAARWCDGALDAVQLARVFGGYAARRARGFDTVISGGGGEHFNHFPWMSETVRAGRTATVDLDRALRMRMMPRSVDPAWLGDGVQEVARTYMAEQLTAAAQPYARMPNTTQLDRMYHAKSVGHFGAYRSAAQGMVTSVYPCYHREAFQASFSVRHAFRNHHRLQRAVIQRLSPAFARVDTDRGGPAAPMTLANAPRFAAYGAHMSRKALVKFGVLGAPRAAVDEPARLGRRAILDRALDTGTVDPGRLRVGELVDGRVLAEGLDGRRELDWVAVGRILSVESALALT